MAESLVGYRFYLLTFPCQMSMPQPVLRRLSLTWVASSKSPDFYGHWRYSLDKFLASSPPGHVSSSVSPTIGNLLIWPRAPISGSEGIYRAVLCLSCLFGIFWTASRLLWFYPGCSYLTLAWLKTAPLVQISRSWVVTSYCFWWASPCSFGWRRTAPHRCWGRRHHRARIASAWFTEHQDDPWNSMIHHPL